MDKAEAVTLLLGGPGGIKDWNTRLDKRKDLSGVEFSHADLSGADLRGAYLAEADLRQANLTKADLTKANLTSANLAKANLSYAMLREASFERANLTEADLRQANLTKADLIRATLTGANLTRANLIHADFSQALLDYADFAYCLVTGSPCSSFRGTPRPGRLLYRVSLESKAKRSESIRVEEFFVAKERHGIEELPSHERDSPSLYIYFDTAEFSTDDIVRTIVQLSSLYSDCGGDELVIEDMTVFDPSLFRVGVY